MVVQSIDASAPGSRVFINECVFDSSKAQSGGAISIQDSIAYITSSMFVNNRACQ